MLDRIKQYLLSDDIEMVKLGGTLMESQINRNRWKAILEECSEKEMTGETSEEVNQWYAKPKKWRYVIKGNKIIIYDINDYGSWAQLQGNYKTSYSTKSFNIKSLTEAIKCFNHGKKNTTDKFNLRNKIKNK